MRSSFRTLVTPLRARVVTTLAAVGLVASLGACGNDPFAIKWSAKPDTVTLYSLSRPDLNLQSAYDFRNRVSVVVESPSSTGRWDMAVDTRNGRIVMVPAAALGVDSRAGIVPMPDVTFDELTEAPADTSVYITDRPVPMDVGSVYVVRTRKSVGSFGSRCFYYAKMEPLSTDPEAGTLTFYFDGAHVCNDRSLIPPD
jgi:hypothetical protein